MFCNSRSADNAMTQKLNNAPQNVSINVISLLLGKLNIVNNNKTIEVKSQTVDCMNNSTQETIRANITYQF